MKIATAHLAVLALLPAAGTLFSMYSGPCATTSDDACVCASICATGGLCNKAETAIPPEKRWGDAGKSWSLDSDNDSE